MAVMLGSLYDALRMPGQSLNSPGARPRKPPRCVDEADQSSGTRNLPIRDAVKAIGVRGLHVDVANLILFLWVLNLAAMWSTTIGRGSGRGVKSLREEGTLPNFISNYFLQDGGRAMVTSENADTSEGKMPVLALGEPFVCSDRPSTFSHRLWKDIPTACLIDGLMSFTLIAPACLKMALPKLAVGLPALGLWPWSSPDRYALPTENTLGTAPCQRRLSATASADAMKAMG